MVSFHFFLMTFLNHWERALLPQFYEKISCELLLFHSALLRKQKHIPATSLNKHGKNFRYFRKTSAYITYTMCKTNFQKEVGIKNTKDINQSNLSIS